MGSLSSGGLQLSCENKVNNGRMGGLPKPKIGLRTKKLVRVDFGKSNFFSRRRRCDDLLITNTKVEQPQTCRHVQERQR